MRPSPCNIGASNNDTSVTCINTTLYQSRIQAPDITTVDEKGVSGEVVVLHIRNSFLSSYRAFVTTLNIYFNLFLETPRLATVRKGAMSYQQDQPKHSHAALNPHDNRGVFEGGSYSVTHRDTNAVLNIKLQQGITVRSRSGAMIHMSGSIVLSGKTKFSFGKLFTGGQMFESEYDGPGSIALGPTLFGDIMPLHIDGSQWTIGRDAFLACTSGITKKREVQGLGKALFSGEDLFVYRIEGHGVLWLTSFGAVDRLDVSN